MKTILVAFAVALLAGCASGLPTRSSTSVDGVRVVAVDGHGAMCSAVACPGLGAEWRADRPGEVLLSVHLFNDVRAILGAEVGVGGRAVPLRPVGLTDFRTLPAQSRRAFLVPLGLVRELAASDDAWLRVSTSGGYVEERLATGADRSKASDAMARLVAAVEGGVKP